MSGFEVTSRPHKQQLSISGQPTSATTYSSSSSLHTLPSPPLRLSPAIANEIRSSDSDPKPPRIPNGSQLLVTRDSDAAYFVDLSNSTSPAAIKERIYAKLGIYDDEHANCRISRARAGQPIGLPLDDWQLWDLCMRSNQDSDPPMLIVISAPPSISGPLSAHSAHSNSHLPPASTLRPLNSPHSPDSSSQPKYEAYSSSGERESPDYNGHLQARTRWQHTSIGRPESNIDPKHPRTGSFSQSHPSSSQPLSNQNSLAPPSHLPPHTSSPISPGFFEDRRASATSHNTPFEIPGYLLPRHSKRPPVDNPEDRSNCPTPHPIFRPEDSTRARHPQHHGRRPSEPTPHGVSPGSSQLLADYGRQPRTPAPSSTNALSPYSSRPHPPSTSSPSARRELPAAKSMEDLRNHGGYDPPRWALPGATHPPLPAPGRVPGSTAVPVPPLRIPRNNHHPSSNEPITPRSLQQLSANSSRSSHHPSSLTPSMPFPQPAPLRGRAGVPGYGPRPSSSSGATGGFVRTELRTGPPPTSSRQQQPSIQPLQPRPPSGNRSGPLPTEARYLEQSARGQQQWPPEPSPKRPTHLIDRSMQAPLATQPHIQHAVSHSALQIRPGDILQDAVPQGEQRRERLREFRGERDREPGILRRPMTNPNSSTSASLPTRHRYSATTRTLNAYTLPARLHTSSGATPGKVSSFSVGTSQRADERPDLGLPKRVAIGHEGENSSRVLRRPPHQPKSASQTSSVRSSDSSLPSPLSSRLLADESGERANHHSQPTGRGLDRKSHTRRPHSARSSPSSDCPSPATESSVFSSVTSQKPQLEEVDLGPSPTSLLEDLLPPSSSHLAYASPDLDSSPDPPLSTPTLFAGRFRAPSRQASLEHGYSDEGVQTVRAEDLSKDLAARFSQLQMDATVTTRPIASETVHSHSTSRSPTSMSMSTGTWRTSMSSNPTTACSNGTELAKVNPFGFIEDDDDEEVVGTFLTPMQPSIVATPPLSISGGKPKLTLNTDTADPHPSPPTRLAINHLPQSQQHQTTTTTTNSSLSIPSPIRSGDRRTSFTGDDWAVRPAVDEVYEHLEEFFPHHDLDKPIDIGPPPPSSSPLSPSPSPAPVSSSRLQLLNGRARSIRVVAQEKKRLLKRTEQPRVASAGGGSALLRRKSTKLWGARTEEVTPGMALSIPSAIEEVDSASARDEDLDNFSFKWVKGELIGKGSFGQVYLALNATNGEMLAVKQVELPKTRSDRDDERQKSVVAALKSEIHLMRDLEHPNIVQYLGFEETTIYLSIFLEYIPGGSIGRCLRRHGAFELNVIKSFTSQTLEGLKYLHSLHILHRDLKADNLLVDLSGNCKISDFGISKKSDNIYEDNTAMSLQGSIFWMAPEVVHNPGKRGYSAKVDIWSLGCVVLEMFAGRRPWSDEEAIQAMFKLGAERLRPPVPADVKLGRMSDHFLAQCFIVDPELRPTADRLTDHRFLEFEDKSWRFEDSELYRSIRMPATSHSH